MNFPRVIPVLLLKGGGFVKTRRFRDPVYLGDPINILRIFNAKEVDEIVILDIGLESKHRPRFEFLARLTSECFMPVTYGGGISSLGDMERLFSLGVEKVAINSALAHNPDLIRQAAAEFGSQSIVASVDVKRNFLARPQIVTPKGQRRNKQDAASFCKQMEELGAGEILLQSVDRDGCRTGYDLELVKSVSASTSIPVVACGGAKDLEDMICVIREGGASAAAAGSFFVFHGVNQGILINAPSFETLASAFK